VAAGVRLRASDGGSIAVGSGCDLSRGVEIVAQGGHVQLGRGVFVGPWTTIASKMGVSIGDDCLIAERVTIRDQDHVVRGDASRPIRDAGFDTAPILIGDGVWIAAGAVVLKGVRIGRGAVVAANAVVTGDVAEFDIVGGVPARRIGTRALADG
jgi:acetyltransferase-like isoleucine patch superfamily enzyme